jgi:hypothetical protein
MKKDKPSKDAQIVELTRKLRESDAGHAHRYYFSCEEINGASTDHLMASGVVLTLTALGGREIIAPVLIHDGLSKETIEALKADLRRSFGLVTRFKPKGFCDENQNICSDG